MSEGNDFDTVRHQAEVDQAIEQLADFITQAARTMYNRCRRTQHFNRYESLQITLAALPAFLADAMKVDAEMLRLLGPQGVYPQWLMAVTYKLLS